MVFIAERADLTFKSYWEEIKAVTKDEEEKKDKTEEEKKKEAEDKKKKDEETHYQYEKY